MKLIDVIGIYVCLNLQCATYSTVKPLQLKFFVFTIQMHFPVHQMMTMLKNQSVLSIAITMILSVLVCNFQTIKSFICTNRNVIAVFLASLSILPLFESNVSIRLLFINYLYFFNRMQILTCYYFQFSIFVENTHFDCNSLEKNNSGLCTPSYKRIF